MNDLEHEILTLLDKVAIDMNFPAFANANYAYCGSRMNVYSNDKRDWAICIQSLSYSLAGRELFLFIYGVGNNLKLDFFHSLELANIRNEKNIYNEDNRFIGDIFDFELELKGKIRQFKLTNKDYHNVGIINLDLRPDILICRYCCVKFRDELFMSANKLLDIISPEKSLKEFLDIDYWSHPDITDNEKPSDFESFQLIAKALSNNDPLLYMPKEAYRTSQKLSYWDNSIE